MIYVLASSSTLNSDTLGNAYLSLDRPRSIEKQILWTSSVDKRDRFPKNLLTARYVVVADPNQFQGDLKDQLDRMPVDYLLKGENIGTSYNKLPYVFNLQGGVKVYIYEKARPFRQEDLDYISSLFRARYPEWGDYRIS